MVITIRAWQLSQFQLISKSRAHTHRTDLARDRSLWSHLNCTSRKESILAVLTAVKRQKRKKLESQLKITLLLRELKDGKFLLSVCEFNESFYVFYLNNISFRHLKAGTVVHTNQCVKIIHILNIHLKKSHVFLPSTEYWGSRGKCYEWFWVISNYK